MREKKIITGGKKTRILTHNVLQKTTQGKFFNYKSGMNVGDISTIRNNIDVYSFKEFTKILKRLPIQISTLNIDKPKPKDLCKNLLTFKDFDTEFFWAKNVLSLKIEKINSFLQYKNRYSHLVLIGNYVEADEILNQIEKKFGISIWLIKSKIAFYQISSGLEQQKKYTTALKKQLKNGSLAKFIVHWLSIRNEKNTTVSRFKSQLEPTLIKLNDITQEGFREFLIYHLFENEELKLEELIHALRLSFSFSIIDYYESFVSLLKVMTISAEDEITSAKAYNFLLVFSELFNDCRIRNLSLVSNINVKKSFNLESITYYDSLIKGKRQFSLLPNILNSENDTTVSIILDCYTKYLIGDSEKTENIYSGVLEKIIASMSRILREGIIGSQNEYIELQKILMNFSNLPWSTAIQLILSKENSMLEGVIFPKNSII
ncbi:hypothetical protein [Chryseobacterium wangxinyae]|uniref:hypothetical protein n=1 Tax=Chryseobacterium sp. CY353 TaxID=2997334 RepID=UPI00226DC28F|nr:hypothetical protein [Chryseobacterium sp. CY353]MCY0971074.1 hypothetical protein [Chryseobacterium sp. CY353]